MRYLSFFGTALAAILLVSTQADAQGFFPPISVAPAPVLTGSVIGPDGTYYALVPSSTSTRQAPVTQLMAISVTGATKWTANIAGEFGQVLAGLNDVYLVQTATSGSGRSTTITTSLLVINTSTGTAEKFSPLTPAGNISDIQVRTVGTNDYLYINSVSTTSSSSGGTITSTITQTLSIYLNVARVIGRARRDVRRWGMSTTSRIAAEASGPEAGVARSLVSSIQESQEGFHWLDKSRKWFWFSDLPGN